MNYFINNIHFFHEHLSEKSDFAPRLLADVDEMSQQLITSWNAVIREVDHVYYLGDFATHPQYEKVNTETLKLVTQPRGTIHLIKGSHDSHAFFRYLEKNGPRLTDGSSKFYFYNVGATVRFDYQQYYLTHYPVLLRPNDTTRDLHGHIYHYSVSTKDDVNVGVDTPERKFLKEKLPFGISLSEQ